MSFDEVDFRGTNKGIFIVFIGELASVTGRPASATVKVDTGTRYLEWDREDLDRMVARVPAMMPAINRLLVRDMAEKIVRS